MSGPISAKMRALGLEGQAAEIGFGRGVGVLVVWAGLGAGKLESETWKLGERAGKLEFGPEMGVEYFTGYGHMYTIK